MLKYFYVISRTDRLNILLVIKGIMSHPDPKVERDNYRMSLSHTQFLGMLLKDRQGTTNKHCPFEIKTFKHIYDHINKNQLKPRTQLKHIICIIYL